MTHPASWMLAAAMLAALAGCDSKEQAAPAAPAATAAHQPHGTSDRMTIDAAWSRAVPPNAPVAAGYLTLHNGSGVDDRLLEVRSDAAVRVEIHEVRHEDGMARMRQLMDGLAVAAGATVELRPGGYHLMFITPGEGFVAGERIAATLVFAQAGEIATEFEVRAIGSNGDEPTHGDH